MDTIRIVPQPVNEPSTTTHRAAPNGQSSRCRLEAMAAERVELTMAIGGEHRLGGR